MNSALIEHRKVETAHFAIRFPEEVQDSAAPNWSSSSAQQDDGQVRGIVSPSQHARAKQQHRVVEQGPLAFVNRLHLPRNIADLLYKKLVHLQPVCGVGVRQQM